MEHKYTAKVYLADGETLMHSDNEIEALSIWMNHQAEASLYEMKGEIIDNHTLKTVKHFHYVPTGAGDES